jgi:hypothetical protein
MSLLKRNKKCRNKGRKKKNRERKGEEENEGCHSDTYLTT